MANTLATPTRRETLLESSHFTLLKTTPAAEVLGISRRTLQELVAAREVACIKIGRSIRFSPADLADFVERNRVKAIGWKGAKP